MTDSDARANDDDVLQKQAHVTHVRVQLLSRLKATPQAKTIEEELRRIVTQFCEVTIETEEMRKKLQADTIKQLKEKIKQSEEDMEKGEMITKWARGHIDSRHMEAQPASEDIRFLDAFLPVFGIDWKLLLGETQQVVDEAGQGETNGNASANVDGA